MNGPNISPAYSQYEKWVGEEVEVKVWNEPDIFVGKVKAAKNGAMILIPLAGRRQPKFVDFDAIEEIRAVALPAELLPPVTLENVRLHMLRYHAWNTPNAPAKDLLDVHENLHKLEDGSDAKFGHVHSA